MMTSFDNNEDKVCSFFKDDVGKSRIRLCARLHNFGSCDYGIRSIKVRSVRTIASFDNKLNDPIVQFMSEVNCLGNQSDL